MSNNPPPQAPSHPTFVSQISPLPSNSLQIWLIRTNTTTSSGTTTPPSSSSSSPPPPFNSTNNLDVWTPAFKVDTAALNDNLTNNGHNDTNITYKSDNIPCEFTRSNANIASMKLRYNFWDENIRLITFSTWFISKSGSGFSSSKSSLGAQPLSREDNAKLESLYSKFTRADTNACNISDFSVFLDDAYNGRKWKAVIYVYDEDDSASRSKGCNGVVYGIKLKGVGLLGSMCNDLYVQRGYGDYIVEGEKEEAFLSAKPTGQLIFVVHGIGENLWSRSDITISPSLISQVNDLRLKTHKRQYSDHLQLLKKHNLETHKLPPHLQSQLSPPLPPGKIEVLPIIWYERIHKGTDLKRTLDSVTLKTIPLIRSIANEIIFDVLMYMQPEFAYQTLDFCTMQISELFLGYSGLNPGFSGEVSLIGHSLGSLIVWDLLNNLKYKDGSVNTTGPTLPFGKQISTLPFNINATFLVGSPLGLFLTLRGGADEMSVNRDFNLGCNCLANVFHPSDPVAYRIEPLLIPQTLTSTNSSKQSTTPEPKFVPTAETNLFSSSEGIRLHLKVNEVKKTAQKAVDNFQNQANSMFSSFLSAGISKLESSIANSQGADDAVVVRGDGDRSAGEEGGGGVTTFALGGSNKRVDFSLQTGMLEAEMLASITAHTCYLTHDDVIAMVARTVYNSKQR